MINCILTVLFMLSTGLLYLGIIVIFGLIYLLFEICRILKYRLKYIFKYFIHIIFIITILVIIKYYL